MGSILQGVEHSDMNQIPLCTFNFNVMAIPIYFIIGPLQQTALMGLIQRPLSCTINVNTSFTINLNQSVKDQAHDA